MTEQQRHTTIVLPIPDKPRTGSITYDAKDPETRSPRSPSCAPQKTRQTFDHPPRRCWFRRLQRLWRPVQYAHGGTPCRRRPEVQPLSHHRVCSPTRQAMLTGRNHHTVGMGGITEIATACRLQLVLPNTCAPLPKTLKLNGMRPRSSVSVMRCRSGRQVPQVPLMRADRRRRLRIFLWLHRRRSKPMVSLGL